VRVLHLLKTSVGGPWALRQICELVRLGVEVHVSMPPHGPMVERFQQAGAIVHQHQFDLPVRRPWLWPAVFERFRGLVREVAPDLIHSHFVGTTLTMRMALGHAHGTPRVFMVPGPLHLEHTLFRRGEIASAGAPDHWIGSCRWTCERYVRAGVPAERVHLAYYGLELEQYTGRTPGRLRGELKLGSDAQIVGTVSYMYPPKRYLGHTRGVKGHEDLIDASALALRDHPRLYCVVVGSAPAGAEAYERAVREYARARCGDRVIFLGHRTDVYDLYLDFDVAVHPSHSENIGGAPESLLLGVPTVTTNVGGFPDVIREGATGWMVPPHSPERLARVLCAVLSDPEGARETARRGAELSRQLFDTRRTAADVQRIYSEILAKHKA
jgi:glycosyltransferase involved in cell wall biosynthesis